ncbi:MAG TPA: polyprenyl synthetase family protein [bacterium]|nr:polyprenyl synthetase family protein [bacterium]
MDIKSYLSEKKSLVEAHMCKSIGDKDIPETLRRAMQYSLDAGGKRIRPVLVMAGAEAVGGDAQSVLPGAVAMEMIHTFSLIHDDLPAMDDDSLRRGQPTNHKIFGEANAILAGDGLLAEAFYVMARGLKRFAPELVVEVIGDIASATGARGMTGGQVIDIESTGRNVSENKLDELHMMKTGALLRASVTSGAKLSGASNEHVALFDRYGMNIGLAFQIADDILDIEGDQALLGKNIGSDEDNQKSTYPLVLGMEKSKRRAASLIDEAVSLLAPFGNGAEPLALIARYIIERNK